MTAQNNSPEAYSLKSLAAPASGADSATYPATYLSFQLWGFVCMK